ncbi:MAG: tRNA guanosine(34) transglycosylase Tgt [Armatimonadetes bacterium]|nr:tRNA guanosine(34) transglycosylase Tgt [Armatimonadota bacterium]
MFKILKAASDCAARAGVLTTPHGAIETPVFMPVGTQATVKAITQQELEEMGYGLILGNTYHLYLRPGPSLLDKAGKLRGFMGWNGAILTDSGGFQVFSLKDFRKIDEDGVSFKSYLDGTEHRFTPESVIEAQIAIGADIIMAFDECAPYPCDLGYAAQSMERTHRWAARCLETFRHKGDPGRQALFGIVQGSVYPDLRRVSAETVASMDFPGIAIGGVSVGEPQELMFEAVEQAVPYLPAGKPRYLMGVGAPVDMIEAVIRGVDMFDCVLPTRIGRNGSLYTSRGRINIKGSRYAEDFGPIDPDCGCAVCRRYSAAYLRHLYKAREILYCRLGSYHNLYFYRQLMARLREAILSDRTMEFRERFLEQYRSNEIDGA